MARRRDRARGTVPAAARRALPEAATVPWPDSSLDEDECLRGLAAAFGETFAARVKIVPLDTMPLTEQGKPDREAIGRLGCAMA